MNNKNSLISTIDHPGKEYANGLYVTGTLGVLSGALEGDAEININFKGNTRTLTAVSANGQDIYMVREQFNKTGYIKQQLEVHNNPDCSLAERNADILRVDDAGFTQVVNGKIHGISQGRVSQILAEQKKRD